MNRLSALAPALLLMAAGSSLPIQPGKWTTTATIIDMQIPGMPAGMGKMLKGHPTVVSSCITPQQAADGPKSVFQASKGKCHYTSFSMAGGTFNATLQCAGGGTTTGVGTYTATSMDVMTTGTMPQGGSSKIHVVGKRVGAC